MWSVDFMELDDKRLLIKTLDEHSTYRTGCDRVDSETAACAVAHMKKAIETMGEKPLLLKIDHGSAFMSGAFMDFLEEQGILPYPTKPRAPWTNGRTERDNQEIHNWLIPVVERRLPNEILDLDLQDGLIHLNHIKPRAILNFRTASEAYFNGPSVPNETRQEFLQEASQHKHLLRETGGEKIWRNKIRQLLMKWKLYEEWDITEGPTVNRSESLNVAN
jgi:IS30 family transposase